VSAHPHNPTILDARTCPLCRQGDQVARVATLVRAGTTVSTGVGALALAGRLPGGGALNLAGGSTGAGMGQTALAARLAPPPAPVFDHTNWFRGGIALVVALPIAIGFAAGDGAFGWLMLLCVVAAAVATIGRTGPRGSRGAPGRPAGSERWRCGRRRPTACVTTACGSPDHWTGRAATRPCGSSGRTSTWTRIGTQTLRRIDRSAVARLPDGGRAADTRATARRARRERPLQVTRWPTQGIPRPFYVVHRRTATARHDRGGRWRSHHAPELSCRNGG